jgi:acyl-CoA thioester hydrolase
MNLYYSHVSEFRVRYSETDRMGYCYHGNYATYFELGRVEALRSLGVVYKELEDEGILLPVVSMNTQFKAPAKYDDLLRLETTLVRTTNCTLEFNYVLFDQNARILTTASTVLVFQSLHQSKPIRIPDFIQTIFKAYEIQA